jgi:hypothetical protein
MKKLRSTIKKLLALNNKTMDKSTKMILQENLVNEIESLAKANNTILGRLIKFDNLDANDTMAIYIITNVHPKTVQIDWVNYNNGWLNIHCGKQALIDFGYAKEIINIEDKKIDPNKQLFHRAVAIIYPTATHEHNVLRALKSI